MGIDLQKMVQIKSMVNIDAFTGQKHSQGTRDLWIQKLNIYGTTSDQYYVYIYMLHIASQLKYLWNKILKPFHVDADLGVQLRVTEMGNGDIIP